MSGVVKKQCQLCMIGEKMRNVTRVFLSLFTLMSAQATQAEEILLTTEDYAPFNYLHEGEIVGIGPDQAHRIMSEAGIPYSIKIMQWSRAIGLAQNKENTCVFTADLTPERAEKFVWVEPLYTDKMVLIAKNDFSKPAETIEDSQILTIGAQSGDSTQEVLESLNYKNIQTTKDLALSVKKLLAGRIDAMAVSYDYFNVLKKQGLEVKEILTLKEVKSGFACHQNIDTEITKKMQLALNNLISSGEQDQIIENHNK